MSIRNLKNIPKGESSNENDVEELLRLLEEHLPQFPSSGIFVRDIFAKSDENHYTETLIKFLGHMRLDKFAFKPQILQKDRRTCDIGIHLQADSEFYIFCIEAKFLPHSPNDYVIGKYAAIKRFKKSEHGISNTNPEKSTPLPQNGIIAYVKSGNFIGHQNKINTQLTNLAAEKNSQVFDLNWTNSEKLKKIFFRSMARLLSKHKRHDGSVVSIHHFWLKINHPK
jgi:hypothetical protein